MAELLSSGRSNSAIAVALSLSARTVGAHIATLFNKFDVRSRTELALRLRVDSVAKRSNFPLTRKALIGRETDLGVLSGVIRSERLVTIAGSAGVGKTLLAHHVGVNARAEFDDGAWLVECGSIGNSTVLAAAILDEVGGGAGRGSAFADLSGYLSNKRLLVILDNCEHIVVAAAEIAEQLLRTCPRLHIIVTSREPLKITGETVYRLSPLPHDDAIDLFAARAHAVNHRFARSAANVEMIGEICRRLDRIPLAIEFAASRANLLSLPAIAERLEHRLTLLETNVRLTDHRHQTIRALIDWSYDLLSSEEQQLFEYLSIFAGGSTLVTIAATQGLRPEDEAFQALFNSLSSLVDKSLIVAEVDDRETRYGLLESTREYAHEKLVARGHREAAAHAHAAAYLWLAERLADAWAAGSDQRWAAEAKPELANFRAALSWTLVEGSAVTLGQRLAAALRLVWMNFGYAEGQHWIRVALSRVDATTPLRLVAALEFADAQMASALGDLDGAYAAAVRALEKSAHVQDQLGKARAQQLAGRALTNLGRVAEAEPLLNDALAFTSGEASAARLHGIVLESLGHARSTRGDLEGARTFFSEALKTFNALGADMGAAIVANTLGEAEFRAGDCESALRYAGIALARSMALSNEQLIAIALCNMSAYNVRINEFDGAQRYALAVVDQAVKIPNNVLVWAIQHLAAVAALRPQPDNARAARMVGFVDARLPAARQFTEQQEYERIITALHKQLTPKELRREMLLGGALSEAQAVGEARADAR